MSVYLIDYENVHYAGLKGIDQLTPADEVIMFYGNSASTIPMELHIDIAKSGAKVQYLKIERTGKNYLDFQLSAMTGYMVGTTSQTEYIIISKDTGYEAVLDLWNGENIAGKQLTFLRREQIEKKPEDKKPKKKGNKTKSKVSSKTSSKTSSTESEKQEQPKQEQPKQEQSNQASAQADNSRQNPSVKDSEKTDTVSGAKTTPGKMPVSTIRPTQSTKPTPKITEAQKKAIRNSVKELGLKPSDYTKVYRAFMNQKDKQAYNVQLVKQLKQETGNAVYKNTVKLFDAAHEA